jgi:ubiquinone/menaquinone biosynthesis C-methylase UbiE
METHTRDLVDYYTKAGPDYHAWSKQFNMHFGFYQLGMNPLHLEGMLDRMNREVLDLLELDSASTQHILDMGCGLGATARHAALAMPGVRVCGLTIVPWQITRAVELTQQSPANGRVRFVAADYNATPFNANSFDGVYALESSCYAAGYGKEPLLREMYRVLKPGRRFVVADAFLKTTRRMGRLTRACYDALCRSWALQGWGEIHHFARGLDSLGFTNVRLKNISRNVTPSVLHVPPTILRFALKELFVHRSAMNAKRWSHMVSGLLLFAFALDRSRSGYFMISGTKGEQPPRDGGGKRAGSLPPDSAA